MPPVGSPPGSHTVPVVVSLTTAGYASVSTQSYIYLTVKAVAAVPQPAQGPIPTVVGYALGISLTAALGLAIWKRG